MGPFEEPASVQIGAQDSTMPIAVIGMSFHGPGEANSVESFYNLLVERRETWSKVPEDRWNHDAFYHPDPMRNGTVRSGRVSCRVPSKFTMISRM